MGEHCCGGKPSCGSTTGTAPTLNVIMLGTPGCGKSEVYRRIVKRLEEAKIGTDFPRVDDFPKLHACFVADDAAEKAGKPRQFSRKTSDGGWLVTNPKVWDKLLTMVNEDVLQMQTPGRVLFIEFARPDMVHSILEGNFSKTIVENALAVYIRCPFNVCWARNVARHEKAVAAGSDDHLVSREEMESTYGTDDHKTFLADKRVRSILIDNSTDDLSKLDSEIDKVVEKIRGCLKR